MPRRMVTSHRQSAVALDDEITAWLERQTRRSLWQDQQPPDEHLRKINLLKQDEIVVQKSLDAALDRVVDFDQKGRWKSTPLS